MDLDLRAESLLNATAAHAGDMLRFFDDETLLDWAGKLSAGEPVVTPLESFPRLVEVLAGVQLANEVKRRLEVAALEK